MLLHYTHYFIGIYYLPQHYLRRKTILKREHIIISNHWYINLRWIKIRILLILFFVFSLVLTFSIKRIIPTFVLFTWKKLLTYFDFLNDASCRRNWITASYIKRIEQQSFLSMVSFLKFYWLLFILPNVHNCLLFLLPSLEQW